MLPETGVVRTADTIFTARQNAGDARLNERSQTDPGARGTTAELSRQYT